MSAIWGAIDLSGKPISIKIIGKMKSTFLQCKIDRYEELYDSNIYLACGVQYFTKEAENEVLPIKRQGLYMTADVILDNRKDIAKELVVNLDEKVIPDGTLLFDLYHKKKNKCLNQLLGAFTFVTYDKEDNAVTIVGDAVGNRYVYYMIDKDIVYFSSLIKPLELVKEKKELNQRWIADFLSNDNLIIFTESEETPIVGINRVANAQIVTIKNKKVIKERFWVPKQCPGKIKYKSDQEYKEHFLALYKECVECTMRSPKETGIFLSGGYDSNSVAALAAPLLKSRNKKLYSFTSVPCRDFKLENDQNIIVDESEAVLLMKEMYNNIECTFMELPEMNPWYDRKKYCQISEIPYKSSQNLLWLYKGVELAADKNVKIMLGGMYGNSTVSFGYLIKYYTYLLRHGKFLSLLQEINCVHQNNGKSRKRMLKAIIKQALSIKKDKTDIDKLIESSYVFKDFAMKQSSHKRLKKQFILMRKEANNYSLLKKSQFFDDGFRHRGEFLQKNSLYSGVIVRDPTKDKRMIEFTLGLPYEQFNKEGMNRRLISEYMKDLIPSSILCNQRRGAQSCDMKNRLLTEEKKIKSEWIEKYSFYNENGYVDCQKAIDDLNRRGIGEMSDFDLYRHIYTIMLLEYSELFT
jgi:asparagine synthase (glutamine-hydrolysing)